MKSKQKHAVMRVTITQDYVVPLINDGPQTVINGWTIDQVKNDWFKNINLSHASRDGHMVGNSLKVVDVQVMSPAEVSNLELLDTNTLSAFTPNSNDIKIS